MARLLLPCQTPLDPPRHKITFVSSDVNSGFGKALLGFSILGIMNIGLQ